MPYFSVIDPVLSFNTSYLAEAAEVELVQPADWSSIECPGLTAAKQSGQN